MIDKQCWHYTEMGGSSAQFCSVPSDWCGPSSPPPPAAAAAAALSLPCAVMIRLSVRSEPCSSQRAPKQHQTLYKQQIVSQSVFRQFSETGFLERPGWLNSSASPLLALMCRPVMGCFYSECDEGMCGTMSCNQTQPDRAAESRRKNVFLDVRGLCPIEDRQTLTETTSIT